MKNQKIILVCALMVVFLLIMTGLVQATSNNDMVINPPIGLNGETTTPTTNNQQGTLEVSGGNNTAPVNNTQNSANNTLPDTGVAEDTTLFVFIAICIISAVYAFIKIKNYKNI